MKPEEFFASLVFFVLGVKPGWRFKTACNFTAIYLAMSDPTVAAIPNLFESKSKAFERELRQLVVDHYMCFLEGSYAKATGLADLTIYVDEAHCASYDCISFLKS